MTLQASIGELIARKKEAMTRDEEEAAARVRFQDEQAAEKARKEYIEAEKMEAWADYCKNGVPKKDTILVNTRGEVYKMLTVLEKPNPKVHGSGKYRIAYIGDDDPRNPCNNQMPLGIFEALGGPGPKDMQRR